VQLKAESRFIEEAKKKYVGKWVGTKDREVVAASDSHEELIRKLKEEGLDNVYVFYSPSPKEKEYGFLFMV